MANGFIKVGNKILSINSGNILSENMIAYNYILNMAERAKLPFTELEELSKDYTFKQVASISSGNDEANYYGDFWTLAHYAGIPMMNLPPRNFSIQHGLITELTQFDKNRAKGDCLVWSKPIEEKTRLEGAGFVAAVGSPFFYAEPLLSEEEICLEKKRLGRNLLAFPMHSTHFINTDYDPCNFLQILKKEKDRFDTVRVCLYWKDIQRGRAKFYQDAGFEVVCSGHIFDQFFLQRQKTLFAICDATISNGFGSHLGYSISMMKPHCLIPDDYTRADVQGIYGQEEMRKLNMITSSPEHRDIINAFLNNWNYDITEIQRVIVDKWWGLSCIRQRDELKDMILNRYVIRGGYSL